jgi:TM2 domain-containing membrane protein YozV
MNHKDLGVAGRAAVVYLVRGYLLFLIWCGLGFLKACRFLLVPIGGGLILLSILGFLFWIGVGLLTFSLHAILEGFSCLFVGLVGGALCALSNGSLLQHMSVAVARARAERDEPFRGTTINTTGRPF